MWAQRAWVKWMREGDYYTKFFHHTANRRRSKSKISVLELDGEELSDKVAISNAFSNLFHELMGTTARSHAIEVEWKQYYPVESRTSLIALEGPFVEEEICRAIFLWGLIKHQFHMVLT